MIPIKPSAKRFQSLNSIVSNFYWKNKKTKISLSTLQRNKLKGGLEAPNFNHYYLANQLQYPTKWFHCNKAHISWIELEQADSNNIKISDLPFIGSNIKHHYCFKNPLISSTLTAWWKTLEIYKSQLTLFMHTRLWHNPDLQLNKSPPHFSTWKQKGITHLHHLFQDHSFISFHDLIQRYGLRGGQFIQYLQIKSIIKNKISIIGNILQPPQLTEQIMKLSTSSKILSKLYKLISYIDDTI